MEASFGSAELPEATCAEDVRGLRRQGAPLPNPTFEAAERVTTTDDFRCCEGEAGRCAGMTCRCAGDAGRCGRAEAGRCTVLESPAHGVAVRCRGEAGRWMLGDTGRRAGGDAGRGVATTLVRLRGEAVRRAGEEGRCIGVGRLRGEAGR